LKNKITNTFRRLDYDTIPELSKPDSYEMMLNGVRKSAEGQDFGVVNEGSTWNPILIPDLIVGAVYVEARNWLLVLLKTGELGYYDSKADKYSRIYDLNDLNKNSTSTCSGDPITVNCSFNFSNCEWINIDYNFWNTCNELHIVFSYNCEFYTVNIDELRDSHRAAKVTCADIKTFKCECIPTIRPVNVQGGGAGLRNGKYRFCLRLINKDGHKSNFFNISKEVFVGGGKNKPGEISDEYISIWITGLSCHYSSIELVVIKSVGSGARAEILDRFDFGGSGITFEYRGDTGREIDIPLEEVTTRKVNYLQGRQVVIHDGRAFYSQIRKTRNLNIQAIANRATVGLDLYRIPAKIAHHYPGLQPGERYIPVIVGQYCDGTETAAGVLNDGSGTELSTPLNEPRNDAGGSTGNETPPTGGGTPGSGTDGGGSTTPTGPAGRPPGPPIGDGPPDIPDSGSGGGGGGGSTSGGNGHITFDDTHQDEYSNYNDLPKNNKRVQEDGYYTDGCITGTGQCEDLGKASADALSNIADGVPDDTDTADSAADCLECGNETKPKGWVEGLKKAISIALFGPWSVGNSKNRKNQKSSQTANGLKQVFQKFLNEAKQEEVFTPNRTKVKVTNDKKIDGGPAAQLSQSGDIGEQFDNINIYKVGPLEPKWVDSQETYPMTLDCSGGYLYERLAGKPIKLLEIPLINHFESPSVGAKGSQLYGVDEEEGFVYMVGLSVRNVVFPDDTGKPLCESQPWKVGIMERDPMNSRVIAAGICIHTFAGDVNGRPHAIPKHGVNSREYIDRYIQRGGDDHEHEGAAHGANIYMFLSPDCLLGHIPLTATHFLKLGDVTGSGWRHGQYAEATKRVGFFERLADQKGTRQTVNMHDYNFSPGTPIQITGITKAQGDSKITQARGIDLPICNLSRETSVAMQLAGSIGHPVDRSFIADGLIHSGLVYDAQAPYGYLIREMPRQYGSIVGAKYIDLGLYAKKGQRNVSGLVGDSFCGPFSVRRTSYISNRVGNTTFIPSPRKWAGFFRFLGFGDPTAPPESGDLRDPKNKANRYPNMTLNEAAAAGQGTGSVYYPGVLKTLVWFWSQSRVNAHYRQRGDEDLGEVHARNLGKLYLDSAVPVGTPWEQCFLNRWYKEILRASRFHELLRPVVRIGIILGVPIYFIIHGFAIHGNLDFILGFWIRIALFLIIWMLAWIWVFTVSRINRMMGLEEQLNDNEGGAQLEHLRQWEDQYTGYSTEYNVGGNVSSSTGMTDPYNVCDCDDCKEADYSTSESSNSGINNLIYYSQIQRTETEINAFKNVLEGDYAEMQSNSSQIQRLITMNNQIFAVTTDGWYRLSYAGDVNYRGVEYLLGNGRALGKPHRIGEGVKEGYYGCIDPNSIIVTPQGALFIDAKSTAVCLFTGAEIKVLSDHNTFSLMQRYLDFCAAGLCRDQKNEGHWYSLGYDPEQERFLVTKRDAQGGNSWTLSYDYKNHEWIGAHSYVPNFYFNDRMKFFSVQGNTIWRHHSETSKQIFYGQYHPFTIWYHSSKLDLTQDHAVDFQVDYIEINTIANNLTTGTRNRHITFTKGGWGNSYQMTGVKLLDTDYYKCMIHKDIRKERLVSKLKRTTRGVWRINELKDNIKNVESPILKSSDCSFFREFDQSNAVCGGDGKKSVMSDYYIRHMLSFDDPKLSDIELKLFRSVVYGKERQE